MNTDKINKIVEIAGDIDKLRDYYNKEIYPLGLKESSRILDKAFKKIKQEEVLR